MLNMLSILLHGLILQYNYISNANIIARPIFCHVVLKMRHLFTSKMVKVLVLFMAVCLLLDLVTAQRRGGARGGGRGSGSSSLSSSDYGFFCLLISSLSYVFFLYSPYWEPKIFVFDFIKHKFVLAFLVLDPLYYLYSVFEFMIAILFVSIELSLHVIVYQCLIWRRQVCFTFFGFPLKASCTLVFVSWS